MISSCALLNCLDIFPIGRIHAHSHCFTSVNLSHRCLNRVMACSLGNIAVLLHIEGPLQVLWSNECQDDDVEVYATHEDAHDFAVVVTLDLSLWCKWEARAKCGLDGRGRGGDEIAKLV